MQHVFIQHVFLLFFPPRKVSCYCRCHCFQQRGGVQEPKVQLISLHTWPDPAVGFPCLTKPASKCHSRVIAWSKNKRPKLTIAKFYSLCCWISHPSQNKTRGYKYKAGTSAPCAFPRIPHRPDLCKELHFGALNKATLQFGGGGGINLCLQTTPSLGAKRWG